MKKPKRPKKEVQQAVLPSREKPEIIFPWKWNEMSDERRLTYVKDEEKMLLEYRYYYYVLDAPVISDYEYDFNEHCYEYICKSLGLKSLVDQFIGWNPNCPGAPEAEQRVLSKTDVHSLWVKSMQPVWDRLGKPKFLLDKDDQTESE